ncbi:MAG TPA: acylneuraminate cytidylyltransferase family protein [bacterium]|nr:acylneuraminate cytidylyltransferase family protein [bacterium]
MKIYAIIPARGGSKGVPDKNIRLLKGYPVIAYSIVACKLSKKIDRIIVSTDSEKIAQISKKYGAEVPFLRPAEFATDISPDLGFMKHAVDWFEINEKNIPDFFIHIRPTTPLREPKIIDKAIDFLLSTNIEYTSLRSGHKCSESPFKWFIKNNYYFESLAAQLSNDDINNPRQNFQEVYIPDGYIDIVIPTFIKENNKLLGDKILAFESPKCTEIDSFEDLEYLDYQLTTKKFEIFEYLKLHFHSENN